MYQRTSPEDLNSIKSNFVTFVVAYAPTEETPEGQKAKYMAALNCTVASLPAREYVFVLTDANARIGKRGEGGGEADSKVLGAYGRDKFNENGKLLLGFAEDNKLALLNTLFCTPKSGVSYTFQSANRSRGQARLDYILTKQADHCLIRCVNVRRPPLKAPESDHNIVYAKVRISHGRLAWKRIRPQSEGQLGTNVAVIFRSKYSRTHRHEDNDEATTSKVQTDSCKEFARLPICQRQGGMKLVLGS